MKPKPLTEEQKEQMKGIMGSLTEPKDIVVTAWYTPQIPVSHGPKDYWGLPGLILEASNGSTTLLCSKVTLNPKEKVAIKVPKVGEKVTRAQLEEIMMAKLNEMNDMYAPAKNGAGTTTKVTTIRIGG
ncbi:MAG: GLPGLI family protein [Sphingobacteriales bacterium]|nr:MAG: GLPGLI family protein [Sphingobacteriales bacterium]